MKSFLVLIASFIVANFSFAQEKLLNDLKGKAKNKVEAQDFNTTRNNRENLQNDKKSSSKSSESMPAGSPPPPAPAPTSNDTVASSLAYENKYDFNANITYQIEAGKNKNVNTVTYFIGESCFKAAMAKDMAMIFDTKNKVVITLIEASKTAMVMSSDKINAYAQHQNTDSEHKNYKITRTGNTKVILGYTCEEVIAESDDSKSVIWIAKETGINISEAFANYFSTNMKGASNEAYQGGLMMEMTSYDKKGEIQAHMLITSISKELTSVVLGAYKITTL